MYPLLPSARPPQEQTARYQQCRRARFGNVRLPGLNLAQRERTGIIRLRSKDAYYIERAVEVAGRAAREAAQCQKVARIGDGPLIEGIRADEDGVGVVAAQSPDVKIDVIGGDAAVIGH